MLLNVLLLVVALVLELLACVQVLQAGTGGGLVSAFIAAHMVASLLLALLVLRLLPSTYRQPLAPALLLPFVLNLFMPVLAMIGLLVALLVARRATGPTCIAEPGVVVAPEFWPSRSGHAVAVPDAGSLDDRMKKLLAVQDLAPRRSSLVLRAALSDSADDLRLLAYGMLESNERKLMQRIQEMNALRRARQAESGETSPDYGSSRELAELHWELVYQNLVQGDMRQFSLEQAATYAGEALVLRPDDGGLWLLLGRCTMLRGNFEEAEAALLKAVATDFLAVRVEPYLAELAFLRRDYTTVRRLMRRNRPEVRLPQLRHAAVFWGGA